MTKRNLIIKLKLSRKIILILTYLFHYSALADLTNDLSYCEIDAVACYDLISISNGDSVTCKSEMTNCLDEAYENNSIEHIKVTGNQLSGPDMSPDGCSGMASAISYYGITFKPACDTHDNCYSNLNSTKSACDANFKIDMEYECYLELDYGQTDQELCYQAASQFENYLLPVISHAYYLIAQNNRKCSNWHRNKNNNCN